MQAKSERFELRLEQMTIDRVDAWRAALGGLPSRAEAVRQLIDIGLDASAAPVPDTRLQFSAGEQLILQMLGDLYKAGKVKGEIDPDFVSAALTGGHSWGLKWRYPGLFHSHDDDEKNVYFVVDVLDMWDFLESGYAKLSKTDREKVDMDAEQFHMPSGFPGFDGNNEAEYRSIARFFIEKLDRFTGFKKRDLNSHSPLVAKYASMLRVFEPLRTKLTGGQLSAKQIITILNASGYL